jgi:hypothetical protein
LRERSEATHTDCFTLACDLEENHFECICSGSVGWNLEGKMINFNVLHGGFHNILLVEMSIFNHGGQGNERWQEFVSHTLGLELLRGIHPEAP